MCAEGSLVLVEGVRDAVAHAQVLAELALTIVDKPVAARARLELLDVNCAEFFVDLSFHAHAAQHRDDTSLRRLFVQLCRLFVVLARRRLELFGSSGTAALAGTSSGEWIEGFGLGGHLGGNLARGSPVDQEAHGRLQANTEARHMRTAIGDVQLVGHGRIGGEGIMGFGCFNHLFLLPCKQATIN